MASYYKKYMISVQKNQSTSQDDVLTKPDPTKIINLRHGSYDKLNDSGYAPEETKLENGDVIFGKITPIVDVGASGKSFRDSSEVYHMHAPGVVDRVYIDIQNQEGYLTREALVRSERIPKIGDKYSCYDEETEILTTKGWIYFRDLSMEHEVATLVDGNTLVYQKPLKIVKNNYKGKMYYVKSNQIDLLVTPNHKMYVKKQNHKEFELLEAKDIYRKTVNYKKNVENIIIDRIKKSEYLDNNYFVLPEYHNEGIIHIKKYKDLDAFLEFMGIWYVEGSSYNDTVYINIHKQRVKNALDILSDKLNYNFIKDEKNIYTISDDQLSQYFNKLNINTRKTLPEWIWLLDQQRCKILLEGILLGDEYKMKEITTFRDDFQRLCLHCGYASNIASVIKTQIEPKVNKHDEWIDYKGKVYCCTVNGSSSELLNKNYRNAENGIVYVRRNKIPCWSGNSQWGQKGTVGILLDRIDMPFTKNGIIPDIILNPNAIPSRMTIGQLLHCLVGKASVLEGMDADGTPFDDKDMDKVMEIIDKHGYDNLGKEYLYNGMTGEKMKVQIFIGPTFYQRLKHLTDDKIHCLTEKDHEVLTDSGWKFVDKITMEDKIACLQDEKLVYQNPIKILRYPNYKGDMYHIATQQIELITTMNHRMWVLNTDNQCVQYNFENAENIVGKYRKYKKNAEWYNENDEHNEQLNEYMKNDNILSLPKWVWKLNKTQCNLLFDHINNRSCPVELIDDMMRLALHCGWSANIINNKLNVNKLDNYPEINKSNFGHTEKIIKNFIGDVFCLEVPSEVFYVRCNGKAVWTGNSRARGPKTSLTRQAPEGRSRDGGLRLGEMERDSLIAHGLSLFIKEKLMDNSDVYTTYVCDHCGLFAQRFMKKDDKAYATDSDIYYCKACNNFNDISKIKIPYAFKLFLQEITSMCIAPRLRCK